jgi:SIR2-like protein
MSTEEDRWSGLRDRYDRKGLVLVLGAGVSLGSGLPTWDDLLKRVSIELSGDEGGIAYESVTHGHGVPLPVIASVLEERSGEREAFVERVREALYHDFRFFPEGVTPANRPEFLEHMRHSNPTLCAVAAMCASPCARGSGFAVNARIHSVVTFNLDYLMQAYVRARYGARLLRTIERSSAGPTPSKLSIYHLHGLLRFDRGARDSSKENNAVVLTEQDYYDFFNRPTGLFTYTFLHLLRESHCLFIGLSMKDENMRRLLHFSKAERLRGLEGEGVRGSELVRKTRRHYALLKHEDGAHDPVVEESLLALGTELVWVDRFEDIPERLRSVYEAGGGTWETVY